MFINYRLADEKDFAKLAQMRRDFQTEDAPQTRAFPQAVFFENCLGFLREAGGKGDWAFWKTDASGSTYPCKKIGSEY